MHALRPLNIGFPFPVTLSLGQAHNRKPILLCAAQWQAKVVIPDRGWYAKCWCLEVGCFDWITEECPEQAGSPFVSAFASTSRFPVTRVKTISNSVFTCSLIVGEPTIWIQDDRLQVLHHYQERYGGISEYIWVLFASRYAINNWLHCCVLVIWSPCCSDL